MKKPIVTAAAGVLAVLLLAGCSGGAAAEAPASAKAKIKVPSPSVEQEASLVAELTKVVPALEARDAVRNSETTCRFILEDRSENAQVKIAKVHFAGRDAAAMTDEDAKRIVEIVKTNGFCTPAS